MKAKQEVKTLSKENRKFLELIYNPDITPEEIDKLFKELVKIQQRPEIRISFCNPIKLKRLQYA